MKILEALETLRDTKKENSFNQKEKSSNLKKMRELPFLKVPSSEIGGGRRRSCWKEGCSCSVKNKIQKKPKKKILRGNLSSLKSLKPTVTTTTTDIAILPFFSQPPHKIACAVILEWFSLSGYIYIRTDSDFVR